MGTNNRHDKINSEMRDCSLQETVSILGEEWRISVVNYEDDTVIQRDNLSGYCEKRDRKIMVCDMKTHKDWKGCSDESILEYQKETLCHEILHAFLYESGLDVNTLSSDCGWSVNEEMIDWFGIQGPKIVEVWKKVGAI